MVLQMHGKMKFRPYPQGVGTFVLLAGAELNHFREFLVRNEVKGLLFSFYYIRKWLNKGSCSIDDLKADAMKAQFCFIDSGGFTLQKAVATGALGVDLQTYIREYYEFAEQMRPFVQVFGAVDCHSDKHGFPLEEMDRAVYQGYDRGIHIAPTLFGTENIESIRKSGYLRLFDIVGLSARKKDRLKSQHVFGQLRRYGLKVHGYAMTSQEEFRAFDFFSVDSSTWLGGQKYGSTYVWRGGKMRTYGFQYKNRVRPTLYRLCQEHGIDFEKVKLDSYIGKDGAKRAQSMSQDILDEINKMNLIAWKQLVDHNLAITNRAYWLKQKAPVLVNEDGSVMKAGPDEDVPGNDLLQSLSSLREQETEEPDVFAESEINLPEAPQVPEDSGVSTIQPYHRKVPMACNDCTIFSMCPVGKADSTCKYTFDELFDLLNPRNLVKESAIHLLQLQFERIQRAALFEKRNGGAIDSQLSNEMSRYFTMLQTLKSLQQDQATFSIHASGAAAEQVTQKGGLLSKLLQS